MGKGRGGGKEGKGTISHALITVFCLLVCEGRGGEEGRGRDGRREGGAKGGTFTVRSMNQEGEPLLYGQDPSPSPPQGYLCLQVQTTYVLSNIKQLMRVTLGGVLGDFVPPWRVTLGGEGGGGDG